MANSQRPYEWYRNMYAIGAVILGIVVIGGIAAFQKGAKFTSTKPSLTPASESNTPMPSILPKKTPSNFPTKRVNKPNQPSPTSKIQPDNTSSFQYPGSIKVSGSVYTTTDSPQTVTDWYKDKIRQSGMQTTTFVQNSVNGNINNVLVGSNGDRDVRVTIKKSPSSATTEITLSHRLYSILRSLHSYGTKFFYPRPLGRGNSDPILRIVFIK